MCGHERLSENSQNGRERNEFATKYSKPRGLYPVLASTNQGLEPFRCSQKTGWSDAHNTSTFNLLDPQLIIHAHKELVEESHSFLSATDILYIILHHKIQVSKKELDIFSPKAKQCMFEPLGRFYPEISLLPIL